MVDLSFKKALLSLNHVRSIQYIEMLFHPSWNRILLWLSTVSGQTVTHTIPCTKLCVCIKCDLLGPNSFRNGGVTKPENVSSCS